MIVGFQVVLIGLVADVISGTRKLLEDLLYRVRVDGARASARRAGRPEGRGPLSGRSRRGLGRHSRRATKPAPSAASSRELLAAAPLARDPRHRRRIDRRHRRARPTAAGARVIRHPYNKGNGAAVKTGIRAATGEFILIIDGDGQHKPADAAAPRRRSSANTISSSARARARRRRDRRGASATRCSTGSPAS